MDALGVTDITVYAGKLSLVSIYSENPRGLISQENKTRLGVRGKGAG